MTRRSAAAFALTALSALGCSDAAERGLSPATPTTLPIGPVATIGMRATVDLVAGTMSFEPTASPLVPAGMQRAVYGDQNVKVKIYNGPVTVVNPSRAGKKTYTGSVGVKNLLAFPIGDEQADPSPPDTMGIYVFLNSTPVVAATSSPCSPACAVTALNTDGALTFVSTSQAYWHYPDRLGAAGTATDAVRASKNWIFEADTQVTRFNFDVLVSAPWSAPNETRFKTDYQGDSLPDTKANPHWHRLPATGGGTSATAAGILTISPANAAQSYYRRDSLGTAENAYIEARIKWNGVAGNQGNNTEPELVLDDGVKFIAIGLGASDVGFITAARVNIGTASAVTTTAFHVYQLRKYAADSAVFYVDNVRKTKLAYASFSATPYGTLSRRVQFGHYTAQNNSTSDWDYVIYELGAAFP